MSEQENVVRRKKRITRSSSKSELTVSISPDSIPTTPIPPNVSFSEPLVSASRAISPIPTKMTGKYSNWNIAKIILASQRFCTYQAFLEFVVNHRYLQFNVKANRDRIRSDFLALQISAPFSETVRFPEKGIYVHLDNPAIDGFLTQLMQALDLPDRAIEKGGHSGTDINDAKRAANVAINELHRLLVNLENLASNGVYERDSFEEKFVLKWE